VGNATEKMVFTSVRDIKEGDELEIDYYLVGWRSTDERLKDYGL